MVNTITGSKYKHQEQIHTCTITATSLIFKGNKSVLFESKSCDPWLARIILISFDKIEYYQGRNRIYDMTMLDNISFKKNAPFIAQITKQEVNTSNIISNEITNIIKL